MNHAQECGAGLAMFITMAPVAGVREGIVPGLRTAYAGAAGGTSNETALARKVAEYPLPNERLLAYAARNSPPQSWYDTDEDLF
jgi:hypothetical protein